jgi:folate-binding protein YgfZ
LENSLGLRRQAADELERHRIGNRYPKFGVDADSETLPQELQRDAQAISFDKGCYLGQETVARIDALGHVNRLLVGLRWESGPLPQLPAELIESDSRVGRMTSLASGSSAVRGLAIVKRAAARPGVQLRCGEAVFTVE